MEQRGNDGDPLLLLCQVEEALSDAQERTIGDAIHSTFKLLVLVFQRIVADFDFPMAEPKQGLYLLDVGVEPR